VFVFGPVFGVAVLNLAPCPCVKPVLQWLSLAYVPAQSNGFSINIHVQAHLQ
jgi:hypothetical protein